MNNAELMNVLKTILIELGLPGELLHPKALLHQDLQLDSTEIVEVSLGLKRRLGVRVKLESRRDMTLIQVCHQVEAALSASRANSV
jgi:acyl carrier protein